LIILVDGGPDENPRYRETIKFACANFLHLGLEALIISTQAPGHSAFNPVERRMAPLSRMLAGIILPYDNGYGWEGIRQVCATLLGARHVPERLCSGPCPQRGTLASARPYLTLHLALI